MSQQVISPLSFYKHNVSMLLGIGGKLHTHDVNASFATNFAVQFPFLVPGRSGRSFLLCGSTVCSRLTRGCLRSGSSSRSPSGSNIHVLIVHRRGRTSGCNYASFFPLRFQCRLKLIKDCCDESLSCNKHRQQALTSFCLNRSSRSAARSARVCSRFACRSSRPLASNSSCLRRRSAASASACFSIASKRVERLRVVTASSFCDCRITSCDREN